MQSASSRACFLGWVCAVQILHNISQRHVSISIVICLIHLICQSCDILKYCTYCTYCTYCAYCTYCRTYCTFCTYCTYCCTYCTYCRRVCRRLHSPYEYCRGGVPSCVLYGVVMGRNIIRHSTGTVFLAVNTGGSGRLLLLLLPSH